MIHFALLISRQGKVRLKKWFEPCAPAEKDATIREVKGIVLSRPATMCNFLNWRGRKLVYRRYASLYFCFCVDAEDNELLAIEEIHTLVEVLDQYFGNVCELDLIFNFHKAYFIFDELFVGGTFAESSKQAVLRTVAEVDELCDDRIDLTKLDGRRR